MNRDCSASVARRRNENILFYVYIYTSRGGRYNTGFDSSPISDGKRKKGADNEGSVEINLTIAVLHRSSLPSALPITQPSSVKPISTAVY